MHDHRVSNLTPNQTEWHATVLNNTSTNNNHLQYHIHPQDEDGDCVSVSGVSGGTEDCLRRVRVATKQTTDGNGKNGEINGRLRSK
jgi:hypothetical protein